MQACSWPAPCYLPVSAPIRRLVPVWSGKTSVHRFHTPLKAKSMKSEFHTYKGACLFCNAQMTWLYLSKQKTWIYCYVSWRNDKVSKLTLTKVNFSVLDKQRIVNINIHYCFVALRYICILMHSRYLDNKTIICWWWRLGLINWVLSILPICFIFLIPRCILKIDVF